MAETDLLEGLLELFQENVENVDFRRAYDPGWGTRLLVRPVVCGQVAAQRLQDGRQETELVFWIFAPEEFRLVEPPAGAVPRMRGIDAGNRPDRQPDPPALRCSAGLIFWGGGPLPPGQGNPSGRKGVPGGRDIGVPFPFR